MVVRGWLPPKFNGSASLMPLAADVPDIGAIEAKLVKLQAALSGDLPRERRCADGASSSANVMDTDAWTATRADACPRTTSAASRFSPSPNSKPAMA